MYNNKQLDMMLEKKDDEEKEQKEDLGEGVRKMKTYILYYLAKTLRPQNLQEISFTQSSSNSRQLHKASS